MNRPIRIDVGLQVRSLNRGTSWRFQRFLMISQRWCLLWHRSGLKLRAEKEKPCHRSIRPAGTFRAPSWAQWPSSRRSSGPSLPLPTKLRYFVRFSRREPHWGQGLVSRSVLLFFVEAPSRDEGESCFDGGAVAVQVLLVLRGWETRKVEDLQLTRRRGKQSTTCF